MATGDLRYKVDIDTRGAQRALTGLQASIGSFGAAIAGAFAFREFGQAASKMDDLRRTFGTLYKSAETGAAAFDDVRKLANQLGLDVDLLAESVVKLKAAGIEPTAAQLRLFADVAAVSTDKVGALQSITDLFTRTMGGGLGLEELERLQDRGIPVYDILIQKLGKSRLELSEFGKTAKGAEVIRAALQQGLSERFGGAAADRANSLGAAMTRFRNAMKETSDTLAQSGIGDAIVYIGNSVASWTQKNKELIKQIGVGFAAAFKVFLDNLDLVIAGSKIFFAIWAANKIANVVKGIFDLSKAIAASPLGLLAVGLAYVAVKAGVFDDVLKSVSDSFNKAQGEILGLSQGVKTLADESNKTATSSGFKVLTEGDLGSGARNFKSEIEALNEKLKIFRTEMDAVATAFARANAEQRVAIDLETSLIGATSEMVELKRAEAEITQRAADEIAKLREQKAKLTEEQIKEGRGAIIDETIKKIEKQAEVDKKATAEAIKNSEARKAAYQLELYQTQNRIDFENKLMDIQKQMAQVSMSEIEKKYDDITRAANESALAAIRAEEARIGRRLNVEEQRQYYEEARRYNEILVEQQKRLYDESRRFETGWTKAFKNYAEEATDAAKQAERIFQKATQGMEDAIVNFAKTGKFEFKGFLNSILEELLRSQIRQLMAQVFNIGNSRGSGGGGGLFGSVGKLLGFANGGIIPTNAPVLVGERGPELISGAAGRNVTPNEQLGLGTTNVIYNISAVDARSFKELVAADPSFIYAVTEQGRRTVPSSRR